MPHTHDIAGPPSQPGPAQDRSGKPVPERIAVVLALLDILLTYATHLAATLECRAVVRGFSTIAQYFGTARLPAIAARLARGILRIQALRRVLLARAERGRDLFAIQRRQRAAARPQPQPPAAEPKPPPRTRRVEADDIPDAANLPGIAELEAAIRRRPIGSALADICRDLGISPSLCVGNFWTELYQAIDWYGGNFAKYYMAIRRRAVDFQPEMLADPNLSLPEQTRDGIGRMLGFFIGQPPVTPFWVPLSPGLWQPAATGPP